MKEKMQVKKKRNLIVVDTNVFINHPYVIDVLANSDNEIRIPLTVLIELDKLKKERVGADAREAIREIERHGFGKNENFSIEKNTDYSGIDLDSRVSDFKILATFNYIVNDGNNDGFEKIKLISSDINMRLIAHSLFKDKPRVSIEEYMHEQVERVHVNYELPQMNFKDLFMKAETTIPYNAKQFRRLNQNAGILINHGEDFSKTNVFVRKGERLKLIKNDFSMFGLQALNLETEINYGQLLAFDYLTDPNIDCVFLEGRAGTGKTFLALAGALAQRNIYEQIIVANPMVPLSNKSSMGFLPGDVMEKSMPWLMPFEQNIRELEKLVPTRMSGYIVAHGKVEKKVPQKGMNNSGEEQKLWSKYGLICQPLEYIRGQTISSAYIIVEEAQNLSKHEIKTITTRSGQGTKIVFCGDLSQIDVPYLNENSSGLTHAIEKLAGESDEASIIAVAMFDKAVRSKLSSYAGQVL